MNLYEKHKISSNLIEFKPKNMVLEPKIEDFSKKKQNHDFTSSKNSQGSIY